jgi:hypothetical protein
MVTWKHNTPAGISQYTVNTYNNATGRTEFDPLGANLSLTAPETPPPGEGDGDVGAGHFGGIMDARWSDFFNISGGCMIDGMASSCGLAMSAVNAGAAVIGPENTTRWNPNLNNGQGGYQFFHAWADGTQGWSPFNWVPGISGSAANPSGPPSLKNVSPAEAARRRAIVAEFGRSGFGDEDVELTSSPDPQRSIEGQKAKFDLARFKNCLKKLFNVSLAPADGRSRNFESTRTGGYFVGVRNTDTVFTIATSMTEYTSTQLKGLNPNNTEPGIVAGTTLRSSPNLNFIASDVASNPSISMEVITAGQMHEDGNSLALITGNVPTSINPNMRRYDGDAGNALTECVYGGFVLLNGTITTNPGGY